MGGDNILYQDKVLTDTHVFEFFVSDLQAIRNNGPVYKYLKAKNDNGKSAYVNLLGMLYDLTHEPGS